jgi:hypothetical protein
MLAVEPLCTKFGGDAEEILELVRLQKLSLQKDVDRYCQEREV